jgi:phage tail protein X
MRLTVFAASAVALVALSRGAAAQSYDYVVKAGDTCDGIAQRVYGDAQRIDLIHAANPWLGPVPHHLQAGAVLHLPPDASLAFVRNHVDAFTPAQHPGRAHEPLMRGHRVSTYDSSSAEVVFASDAVLQLGEDTLVVILGATHGAVTRTASASDTTLVNGSLRLHLGELAGRSSGASVSTPAGHRVEVGAGDTQVTVDAKRTTRLAVYSGAGKLTAMKQTVAVARGFGSKAEKDAPPSPPRPLPPAPEWVAPLPAVVFSSNPADVTAQVRPGTGPGPAAARWHLQLARDEGFNDLIVDARVGLDVTHLEAHGLAAGKYYARAGAIDADQFEGPPTATSAVIVAPLALRRVGAGGQAAQLDLPPGLYCAIGDAPLAATDRPLAFEQGPARRLRCAIDARGSALVETAIPAAHIGPLRVEATLETRGQEQGLVHLRLSDAAGVPVADSAVAARASSGADVRAVASTAVPGAFDAPVTWSSGTPTLRLHVTVNGVDEVDVPELALPSPPHPPAAVADHLTLAGFAGAALETGPYPSRPGYGSSLGAEVGWLHAFDRWGLAIAARGGWEHAYYSRPGSAWLAGDLDLFGLAVTARLGAARATWHPFVGLEPALLLDYLGGLRQPLGFGGTGTLGIALRAAGHGEVFLQSAYRVTSSFDSYGNGRQDAWLLQVGYRWLP